MNSYQKTQLKLLQDQIHILEKEKRSYLISGIIFGILLMTVIGYLLSDLNIFNKTNKLGEFCTNWRDHSIYQTYQETKNEKLGNALEVLLSELCNLDVTISPASDELIEEILKESGITEEELKKELEK